MSILLSLFQKCRITFLCLNEVSILIHHVINHLVTFCIVDHALYWHFLESKHIGKVVRSSYTIDASVSRGLIFFHFKLILHLLDILKTKATLSNLSLFDFFLNLILTYICPLFILVIICKSVCHLKVVFDVFVFFLFQWHLIVDNLSHKFNMCLHTIDFCLITLNKVWTLLMINTRTLSHQVCDNLHHSLLF
jgi:hypothetical protein